MSTERMVPAASRQGVARLVEAGLIERVATLPGDPTLLCATRQGIAYAGLGLPPAT